jgi:hypothetical protein
MPGATTPRAMLANSVCSCADQVGTESDSTHPAIRTRNDLLNRPRALKRTGNGNNMGFAL